MNWDKRIVIVVLGTLLGVNAFGQSPHGKEFRISCDACHTAESWTAMRDTLAFDHQETRFLLEGQHEVIDCRQCHTDLEFSKAETNCASCHLDIHQQSVGDQCSRCHNSESWLVNNIEEIHRQVAFPLQGAHATANCTQCHKSETALRFDPMDTDCFSCHQQDFATTTNPNHKNAGFSTNCIECHKPDAFEWTAEGINHEFFPLTKGHDIQECAKCHIAGDYSQTSPDCISCHEADFLSTTNPNHTITGISTSCVECHTTDPGWKPAEFLQHDLQYFPIYSGSHKGEWDKCVECHDNPDNYAIFTCISCHKKPETDDEHDEVLGYTYTNSACLACHPTGEAEGAFDHNNTAFALTGAHTTVECISCHASGYTGTPTECVACHNDDFNGSTNPDHNELGLSTDCASCHTTAPDWNPATFDNHAEFYILNGAHFIISKQCVLCHQGDYNNTPTTCIGCHQTDFDQTTDPPHAQLQFSTDCATCHTETSWEPSTYDHDALYFPIYSGSHEGEWNHCNECHTTPGNYGEFTCVTCHMKTETDEQHDGIGGYTYNSTACLACHPTGEAEGSFDHSTTDFPLTGAHTAAECLSCHASGYAGTPKECEACHAQDFNQSLNPNHTALGLPMDCASCHTTEPGWQPASFDIHNQYYVLSGAHAVISSQCTSCHNGDYNNTPNTCAGCHQEDYNQTIDPPHVSLQFSQDCATCHNENAWEPSTFDHDAQHFPIYSGDHEGEWSQCSDCHTVPGNYSVYTCITCHMQSETDDEHAGVNGYVYNSSACLACHPTGDADIVFDHNGTNFPLTGAHTVVNCLDCHTAGYAGTPTACEACHTDDFNQSINPNHVALGLPVDCASCHTTEPGWEPASFDIHNQYYALNGAHAAIASQCVTCHNGDYNNTPNTCAGCHIEDYNQTTNPPHVALQFSQECATCHSETAWVPSTFDHDGQYFPIYSGSHEGEWSQCSDCHTTPGNYAIYTCTTCHANPETDEQHIGVNGYVYNSSACLACHPTGEGEVNFDHNSTNFPLTGGHLMINCIECHANGYQGTPTACEACHTDDYNQSINPNHVAIGIPTDCASCHTTNPGWEPATFDIHNQYYVLEGAHAVIASQCVTCHNGDYNNTPNTCAGCHQEDYDQTTNPNHIALQLPTDCASCHGQSDWVPASFPNHDDYYPLNGAHAEIANECVQCHNGDYNNTPNTCVGCHLDDYNQTTDPNHIAAGFGTDCAVCHSEVAWVPATFDHDGQYFPIYSGDHEGTWSQCSECHTNPNDYSVFTCVTCHMNPETDEQHQGVSGYEYNSILCLACHPTGDAQGILNHDETNFPLTGAHVGVDCLDCHANGFPGTPTECNACHMTDYNQSTNPNHVALNIPTDCASCHTTNPGWEPATFDIHNQYYVLEGAHAVIASQCVTCHNGDYNNTPNTCAGCHQEDYNQTTNPNHITLQLPTDCASCHGQSDWVPASFPNHDDYYPLNGAHAEIANECVQCHNGDYNNTPNTCVGCHLDDYNQTTDPNHIAAGFGTDCAVCHSEVAWVPATFDHDGQYFPIYSGDHEGTWSQCSECHTNPNDYSVFTCVTCHMNPETDEQHQGVSGYEYNSILCLACHPTGDAQGVFDHNQTNFPLTGAHIGTDCLDCHANGFPGTPIECNACHLTDYNQSTNPNHVALNIPTDCASCHTTNPDWNPATFDIHNEYYVLAGAHAAIANQCATCHNGNYNNTPNTCVGCHLDDYNQTTNPPHETLNFPTDCATCHSETAWTPAEYTEHDENYFPIYSGAHEGQWDQCNDCHTNPNNYSIYTCVTCHAPAETNSQHAGVNGYIYESGACLACHPTGEAAGAFDHNESNFPLTGAHISVACVECHANGYAGTPTECNACHLPDYNQSTNPSHVSLGLSTDCVMCHTTVPDWNPALFPVHNNYYVLEGAHAAIADQCVTCHNGNYNNTPNTCVGCHLDDYNQTNNPDHEAAQFPTDCAACHTQTAWIPANWDHDNLYFPIYSGSHANAWDQCNDCHTNPNNYSVFTCITCHEQAQTDLDHDQVNGYQYNSAACLACHPQGN